VAITQSDIENALLPLINPVPIAQIDGDIVTLMLEIDPAKANEAEPLRQKIEQTLLSLIGVKKAQIILTAHKDFQADKPQMKQPPARENLKPAGVKHIICVASGKGGVGKSTVAASLAMALQQSGLKVGLMDADIYGPSVPKLFALESFKANFTGGKLAPAEAKGLKLMSIGFLVDGEAPMIWRGPMIQSALRQFLQDVDWGALDVLVVDMPPGTGDAQLTMAQKVPLSGAIIVSTPQDIALIDARKAIEMFKKTDVPILGLIENMSYHICENCGHESHIFGHDGAKHTAEKNNIPFLGAIPLEANIRLSSDQGELTPHELFKNVVKSLVEKLAT